MTQSGTWLDSYFAATRIASSGNLQPQEPVLNLRSGLTVADNPITGQTTVDAVGTSIGDLVADFGGDPTGVTQSDDALDSAISKKEGVANGGNITIPPGTFKFTRYHDLGFKPGRIVGAGAGNGDGVSGTTLLSTLATGTAFSLAATQSNGAGSHVSLENVFITSTFVPAGSSIYPISGATAVQIGPIGTVTPFGFACLRNVSISGFGVGLNVGSVEESTSENVIISHCTIGRINNLSANSTTWINFSTSQCGIGDKITSGEDMRMFGGSSQANTIGVLLAPSQGSGNGTAYVGNINYFCTHFEGNGTDIKFDMSYAAGSNIAEVEGANFICCHFGGNSSGAVPVVFVAPPVPTNSLLQFSFDRGYARGMSLAIPSYASGCAIHGRLDFEAFSDGSSDTTIENVNVPATGPVQPKNTGIAIYPTLIGASAPPNIIIAPYGSPALNVPLPASCIAYYDASATANSASSLVDLSGQGNSALAPLYAGTTFVVNDVNGLPAIYSNGTLPLAYTSNLTGVTGGTGLYIWIAYASVRRVGIDYLTIFGGDGGGAYIRGFVGSLSYTTADYLQTQNSQGTIASQAGTTIWKAVHTAGFGASGTGTSISVDGGPAVSAYGASVTYVNGSLVIGGPNFNGWIMAVVVCNAIPTASELEALQAYATNVWGGGLVGVGGTIGSYAVSGNAMNDALLPATNTILISGFITGGTITGFAGGYPGRIVNLIFIDNISSVTVKTQSASSSVGNRIASGQGTDSVISIGTLTGAFQHRTFMYDGTLSAWRYFTSL